MQYLATYYYIIRLHHHQEIFCLSYLCYLSVSVRVVVPFNRFPGGEIPLSGIVGHLLTNKSKSNPHSLATYTLIVIQTMLTTIFMLTAV